MRRPVRPLPRLRAAAALYRARESLFALPALIVASGAALAEVAAAVDRSVPAGERVPLTLPMTTHAATWLLSTVAGATITTAGVVFSMTVVSLQLASGQFSPRVMRSFVRDRTSQSVIGVLVATFTFCVLALRHVGADRGSRAPAVTLTLAMVWTLAAVLLIIVHVDHLARGLQVGRVLRSTGEEGLRVLAAARRERAREQAAGPVRLPTGGGTLRVRSDEDGWVTRVDGHRLLGCLPPGSVARLETRVGAYVHAGEVLLSVRPHPPEGRRGRGVRRTSRRVLSCVVVGPERTVQGDVDFVVRQLADVGVRALSPAVNDPATAAEAVLRLGGLLRRLLVQPLPLDAVAGSRGRVLQRPWELDHEEYVAHAFDQLRQLAPEQGQVAAALLRTLRMLVAHVREHGREDLVPALEGQLERLTAALRPGVLDEHDVQRLHAVGTARVDPAQHGAGEGPGEEPGSGGRDARHQPG